jgi:hypothetical protein
MAYVINDLWKFTLCIPPEQLRPVQPRKMPSASAMEKVNHVVASGNGELSWYNKAAGGNIIASGANFQTPALNSNLYLLRRGGYLHPQHHPTVDYGYGQSAAYRFGRSG